MGESSCECQNPSCKCECCLMGWGWAMNRKRNRIKLSKRIEQKIKVLLAFKFSFYNFTFYLPSNFLSIFFKSSPTFPFYVSILFSLICLLLYNKIINKIECKGNPFFFLYSQTVRNESISILPYSCMNVYFLSLGVYSRFIHIQYTAFVTENWS